MSRGDNRGDTTRPITGVQLEKAGFLLGRCRCCRHYKPVAFNSLQLVQAIFGFEDVSNALEGGGGQDGGLGINRGLLLKNENFRYVKFVKMRFQECDFFEK